jgi:uncharacterized protein YndB with AHSA1/START domain
MTTESSTFAEPTPELLHRDIGAGPARVAVMTRTYETGIDDLWDAVTNPERLARWYTTVTGDFRVGGMFDQVNMGGGVIAECEAPRHLRLVLGKGGADEIEVRLTPGDDGATTVLEVQHATTLDRHEIGGQMYDAIFCMGGGYYPRLYALDLLLRGELPEDYDATAFHLNPTMRPTIDRGSAAMQALLDAEAGAGRAAGS